MFIDGLMDYLYLYFFYLLQYISQFYYFIIYFYYLFIYLFHFYLFYYFIIYVVWALLCNCNITSFTFLYCQSYVVDDWSEVTMFLD